ncbi:MAG TPA: DUF4349 domain-containing protein [Candidatus Dormibacteraeota bacterium]|nr:DUF4349 domain-containing protein [Candidatus Dormibacteraeota bacterium]
MNLRERSLFAPAVLILVLVGGALAVTMLGGQVSSVMSTVGASVNGPGEVSGGGTMGGDTTGAGAGGDTTGNSSGTGGGGGTDGATAAGGVGAGTGVIDASVRDDLLIIKTGELTLQVDDIAAAVTSATQKIDALSGYVSGSKRSGTGADARATIAFRVPAAQWDAAMNALRSMSGVIVDERSTTADVTSQVVDLGARIRNLQVTEQALQSIMDRAKVIKDVLSVQAELTTTRGEIERLMAEQAHLQEQAAYSSLSVTFVRTPEPVLAAKQDQFDPGAQVDAASASLVGVLQDVETAAIWFGIVWLPILLALAFIGGFGIVILRRVRRVRAIA